MVDEVKIGSLCIVDLKPRILTNEEHLNFLDIGAAVSNLISERNQRKERMIKTCKDSVRMTVDIMASFRNDLLSVHNSARMLLQNTECYHKIDQEDVQIITKQDYCLRTTAGIGTEAGTKADEKINLVEMVRVETPPYVISNPDEYDETRVDYADTNNTRDIADASVEIGNRINYIEGKTQSDLMEREKKMEVEQKIRKEKDAKEEKEKIVTFHALQNIECQIGSLMLILESNMCLGALVVEKAEADSVRYTSFSACNVLQTVQGDYFKFSPYDSEYFFVSVYVSVYMSVCLPVCLSVCSCICLSVSQSVLSD